MAILNMIDPLYVLSGLAVGFIVGMTGVGGGSLMTPLLVLLFGIHPATAVGTDLLYAAATKATGTAVHGWNRTVDWRIAGKLAAGSVPAAVATLTLMYVHGMKSQGGSALISTLLGVALLLTALSLVFRTMLATLAAGRKPVSAATQGVLTVLTGAALGVLVSISSVGAGALGVTALIMLYPRIPVSRIVGTDIAHAVPLTLVAGLGHWLLGSVDWHILGSLLVGSLPGIVMGSATAPKVPESVLRPMLACVLVVVGVRLMWP